MVPQLVRFNENYQQQFRLKSYRTLVHSRLCKNQQELRADTLDFHFFHRGINWAVHYQQHQIIQLNFLIYL